jgi:DNA replication protein DnaC
MMQQTFEQLKEMRLGIMAQALRSQLEEVSYHRLSFEERIGLLVEQEYLARENRKVVRIVQQARLKQSAHLEGVDYDARRKLDESQVRELMTHGWLQKGQNVIITGSTGVGKTYLACALGEWICQRKLSVRYYRLDDLLREAMYAKADGSYHRYMLALNRQKLLILDEWLRTPLSTDHSRIVGDIFDDRYQKHSLLLVSQFPVKDWYVRFEDPTIAEAILDRVVHNSKRLELAGESMRKKKNTTEDNSNEGTRVKTKKKI